MPAKTLSPAHARITRVATILPTSRARIFIAYTRSTPDATTRWHPTDRDQAFDTIESTNPRSPARLILYAGTCGNQSRRSGCQLPSRTDPISGLVRLRFRLTLTPSRISSNVLVSMYCKCAGVAFDMINRSTLSHWPPGSPAPHHQDHAPAARALHAFPGHAGRGYI